MMKQTHTHIKQLETLVQLNLNALLRSFRF